MNQDSIIVRCPTCSTKNRIPKTRLKDRPRCGKCKNPIPSRPEQARPVAVDDRSFDGDVLSNPGPVLVDCWAPWCGPCRMMGPIMDELAASQAGRLQVAKLNVDESPGVASRYGIQSIPTLLLFKGGELVDRIVGAVSKSALEQRLSPYLR